MKTNFLNVLPSYFKGISVLLSALGCLLILDVFAVSSLISRPEEVGLLCIATSFLLFLFSKEKQREVKGRALVLSVVLGAVSLIVGLIICICLDSAWNILIVLYIGSFLQYVLFLLMYYCLYFFQREK